MSPEVYDVYLDIIAVLAIVLAPFAVLATIFMWDLWEEAHVRKTYPKMILVKAVNSTFAAIISVYLAALGFDELRDDITLPRLLIQLWPLALLLMDFIPLTNIGYLYWLRWKEQKGDLDVEIVHHEHNR